MQIREEFLSGVPSPQGGRGPIDANECFTCSRPERIASDDSKARVMGFLYVGDAVGSRKVGTVGRVWANGEKRVQTYVHETFYRSGDVVGERHSASDGHQ